jgi:hypothetical protein
MCIYIYHIIGPLIRAYCTRTRQVLIRPLIRAHEDVRVHGGKFENNKTISPNISPYTYSLSKTYYAPLCHT